MEAKSKMFLVELFTTSRDDLARQLRELGDAPADVKRTECELAAHETLLTALLGKTKIHGDAKVRRFAAGLAAAVDKDNDYD